MERFQNTDKRLSYAEHIFYLDTDLKQSEEALSLGNCANVVHFCAQHRNISFWQTVTTGETLQEVPMETQWLLLAFSDGRYGCVLPFASDGCRCTLQGADGALWIYVESGSEKACAKAAPVACFVEGESPYTVCKKAAEITASALPDLRLITEKHLPDFVNQFGWCTWDSFYADVTAEDVERGLADFARGGVVPKLLILDDGWQSSEPVDDVRTHNRLTSFAPNEKFYGDLTSTVNMAKETYGVKTFLVWHAVMGYWGGVSPTAEEMRPYRVTETKQRPTKLMAQVYPASWPVSEVPVGVIAPDCAFDFYNDYHASLRKQGVDGVKVDVQASLEFFTEGQNSRTAFFRAFRKGLESAADRNFGGRLINCMSCVNDHILNTLSGSVMRSSDDFFPKRPESHGVHVLRNAFAGLYMGNFVLCDWDMFQTQHEFGAFHAASRAISGGPVYVSDKVGEHDFEILKKLTMANGKLPLCKQNAVPTKDSLFIPTTDFSAIFKFFNYNTAGGVVGAFNLTPDTELCGSFSPSDVEGYEQGTYAVYDSNSGTLLKMAAEDMVEVTLLPVSFALYTVSEIINGFAPIGLVNKYNAGGTILEYCATNRTAILTVGDGGTLLCYSEKAPIRVTANGKLAAFTYENNTVTVLLPEGTTHRVELEF